MLFKNFKDKIKNNTFFRTHFGFESGIDITDDTKVLYRKNHVIKNIVFVSNILYTLIFSLITIFEPSNWLLAVLLFPITFFLNSTLKKLIEKDSNDNLRQVIAMYIMTFYMFLSAILIYFKLKSGSNDSTIEHSYNLGECGYILIYYSLAICAYYQDKKLLKNIFVWVMILTTIVHFTITYDIINDDMAIDFFKFIELFFISEAFRDILIRTILLALFMLVTYISVSMTNYMQDERRKELIKRRKIQEDFTKVVTKIFNVSINNNDYSEEEIKNVEVLSEMVRKLSSLLALKPEDCQKVYDFSRVHIDKHVDLIDGKYKNEDEKFEVIRTQTELGSLLISRLQLERKCEDIIRATFEGSNNDDFIKRMRNIQNNQESQIILICDLYVSMRSVKSYKKAYKHSLTMSYLEEHFKYYFDPIIFDRFIRFSDDFEKIYNEI